MGASWLNIITFISSSYCSNRTCGWRRLIKFIKLNLMHLIRDHICDTYTLSLVSVIILCNNLEFTHTKQIWNCVLFLTYLFHQKVSELKYLLDIFF